MDACNRCLVFHSKNDPVLGGAYWIGDIKDGIHPALGLKGPRSKTITLSQTKNVLTGTALTRYDELS